MLTTFFDDHGPLLIFDSKDTGVSDKKTDLCYAAEITTGNSGETSGKNRKIW